MFLSVPSVVQKIYLLPTVKASATENMAADWLLLEAFPEPLSARLRFYGWSRPAFTFGYGQKWIAARAASEPPADLIRRPTGGGLVDHRGDWTYALALPAAHPLAQIRAGASYQTVHDALAESLNAAGVGCQLQITVGPLATGNLSVCFQQAERFDVVRADDGKKIAGAAQKRTRRGLLWQGSVARRAAAEVDDWEKLGESFARRLAAVLNSKFENWKELNWAGDALAETTARFASQAWNEKR